MYLLFRWVYEVKIIAFCFYLCFAALSSCCLLVGVCFNCSVMACEQFQSLKHMSMQQIWREMAKCLQMTLDVFQLSNSTEVNFG